jgi:hypothetical protein
MQRVVQHVVLMALGFLLVSAMPSDAPASPREVLLQDLIYHDPTHPFDKDIYHRPERPGNIVRIVPWLGSDGSYSLLAISELGWVYQSQGGPDAWELVGCIYEEWIPACVTGDCD